MALSFLGVALLLRLVAAIASGQAQRMIYDFLRRSFSSGELTIAQLQAMIEVGMLALMQLTLPVMLAALLISILANLIQGGLVFSTEALKPRVDRLNPATNLKNLFSKRSLVEALKSLIKLAIIGYICYDALSLQARVLPRLSEAGVSQILSVIGQLASSISIRAGLFMVAVAGADYAYQLYEYEQSIKQTKQEVREDYKQTEGDPLIKGQLRRFQREMSRRRQLAAVPEADVVVTNPTHYAVALRYDREQMMAPEVVAKGADYLAQKIREIAIRHDVPLMENPPLARALYKTVEVGQAVPPELYRAVAEVLAYVYRLRERRQGGTKGKTQSL
jgi:flagellar biosynthetic protein FlhB